MVQDQQIVSISENSLNKKYIYGIRGTANLLNCSIAKEQDFVLRNWSYYELQTKIKYQAEKAGIELIIG